MVICAGNAGAASKPGALENGPSWEFNELAAGRASASQPTWTVANASLPGYTIRRIVPEVRIQFTVADSRNRLLQSLSSSDFRILDNRLAVGRISSFSRQEDLPLQVGLLLDVSDSVEKTKLRERQATQFFISHVFRPESDRASLMAFGSEVHVWQRATGDREKLTQALAGIRQLGYATYLYDSVFRACLEQFPASHDDDFAQRILVLISDGEDTGSLHSLADAVSIALRREVQIFTMSVHPRRNQPQGDLVLQRLADATGGKFYVANSEKDFPAIFSEMAQQMRTQYAVSFQPMEQTPGFHAVKIEVAGGDKLRVHARQGYFFDAP